LAWLSQTIVRQLTRKCAWKRSTDMSSSPLLLTAKTSLSKRLEQEKKHTKISWTAYLRINLDSAFSITIWSSLITEQLTRSSISSGAQTLLPSRSRWFQLRPTNSSKIKSKESLFLSKQMISQVSIKRKLKAKSIEKFKVVKKYFVCASASIHIRSILILSKIIISNFEWKKSLQLNSIIF